MHDQRNLTRDAVLRAKIAMANRLIAIAIGNDCQSTLGHRAGNGKPA